MDKYLIEIKDIKGLSQNDSRAYRIEALRAYLGEKVGETALIKSC